MSNYHDDRDELYFIYRGQISPIHFYIKLVILFFKVNYDLCDKVVALIKSNVFPILTLILFTELLNFST